ncbi:nucleotidyltransferase domain protein [bacterium BMS3Abin15]|nr:nucleotidyltransferase domain protein [bacterium BMS3Abin15]HDH31161.1 nucleotidyltransferase domain-containing protein [Candidatus Wolfebacteria bacterium]
MDSKKIQPKKIIKEYLKHIPSNIKVKGVFLFGSYITGKTDRNSDLDFVVISSNFKKMEFMKRLILLSHVQGASKITRSVPMDIIGYTPEEFKNIDKESIIMRRAKREGKMIYSL